MLKSTNSACCACAKNCSSHDSWTDGDRERRLLEGFTSITGAPPAFSVESATRMVKLFKEFYDIAKIQYQN